MCSDLVPLSVFELDCPAPPGGWDQLFETEGVDVVEDDIGRACISREDAGRLLGAHRSEAVFREDERLRRQAEQDRRNAEWAARYPVPAGIPAVQGLSAAEQVLLAGEGVRAKSVTEELLDAELAHVNKGQ